MPGVPLIYYGDEAGIKGGREPDNRRSYPWGKENKMLADFYHKIIKIRNNEDGLKKGKLSIFETDPNVFAFERKYENESVIVLVNVSSKAKLIKEINLSGDYVNLLDISEKYKFAGSDSVITIFPYDLKILRRI